jgi:hypothetical protein
MHEKKKDLDCGGAFRHDAHQDLGGVQFGRAGG